MRPKGGGELAKNKTLELNLIKEAKRHEVVNEDVG